MRDAKPVATLRLPGKFQLGKENAVFPIRSLIVGFVARGMHLPPRYSARGARMCWHWAPKPKQEAVIAAKRILLDIKRP